MHTFKQQSNWTSFNLLRCVIFHYDFIMNCKRPYVLFTITDSTGFQVRCFDVTLKSLYSFSAFPSLSTYVYFCYNYE